METKPIVTSYGNQSLFSSLHNLLLSGLPREPTEWRRSYGRAPKTVLLEASFVPFDEDILPSDTDKTLISRPYFHIFWTDCDLDGYKQSVKEELGEWHSALKSKNNPDWLIVVVINDETKVKSKLLPRSSVFDKVKSDFCSKNSERCMVLNEPFKNDAKSSESWTNFLQRMRGLMLQAFNRHLNKYEENMRSLREKRNEPGWDFINFFLVQEELAFMFEMLGLYDDALIQYDELDALFTQFVITQTTQGKIVGWLSKFSRDCSSWAGLSLRKAINLEKRDQIKCQEATLLDFRNYLFSRHCALLFLMKRPWEVAQRAVNFLHNTIQEVHNLNVNMPDGALDCWVFLNCLEVLQICEKNTKEPSQQEAYSFFAANLLDYARKKLYSIGERCGLMPESKPNSEQLLLVIELTAGMGITDDIVESEPQKNAVQRPRDKLREALSSQETYQKIYMELSELTMGTFKHIGRFRSSRLIGKSLADFYMRLNDPSKAENFLLDALKSYQKEGWDSLADGIRLDLAKCQKLMPDKSKYVRTCCQIIGSTSLPEDVRKSHLEELQDIVCQSPESTFSLKCALLFCVSEVTVLTPRVREEQNIEIEVVVNSQAPVDMTCSAVAVSVKEMSNSHFVPGIHKTKVYKQISNGSTVREPVANFTPVAKQTPSMINVQAHYEGAPEQLTSCAIVCINTHEVLRRADSSGKGVKKTDQLMERDDYRGCVNCEDLVIVPGINRLRFIKKASKEGRYKLNQLLIQWEGADFLQWLDLDQYFWVKHEQPSCSVQRVDSNCLISGIQQLVELKINPGSLVFEEGQVFTLTLSKGLTLEKEGEEEVQSELTIKEEGEGPELTVVELQHDSSVVFTLKSFHVIPHEEEVEAKITVGCEMFAAPVSCVVDFISPFTVTHKLHTSTRKKFLQLVVHGNSEESFELSDPNLDTVNKDVEILSLNKLSHALTVSAEQDSSYLWQMKSNINQIIPVPTTFCVNYQCDSDFEKKMRSFVYNCKVENLVTLYSVRVSVVAKPDSESCCKMGDMACLKVTVSTLGTTEIPEEQSAIYCEIKLKDNKTWAPGEKTKGLIDLKEKSTAEIELDVMPLVPGMLSLPKVQIHRCQHDVWLMNDSQADSADDLSPDPCFEDVKTLPFSPGQVYYASIGHHVNVHSQTVVS